MAPSLTRRPALRPLEEGDDERLAAAGRLTRMLTEDALTGDELPRLAGWTLRMPPSRPALGDWPVRVRAVELVRELAGRVAGEQVR
jgi:hypothetical protein